MITSTSKNQSFVCAPGICEYPTECRECHSEVKTDVHPIKKLLHGLWINIRLFLEADKWEPIVPFKVGDTYVMKKMDEIESQWRNKSNQ